MVIQISNEFVKKKFSADNELRIQLNINDKFMI